MEIRMLEIGIGHLRRNRKFLLKRADEAREEGNDPIRVRFEANAEEVLLEIREKEERLSELRGVGSTTE